MNSHTIDCPISVRIELTRLRGLRQHLYWDTKSSTNSRKNWIDPFEGIETLNVGCFRHFYVLWVRIELTRLRGLRPNNLIFCFHLYSVRIELTRLRGLRQKIPSQHISLVKQCKNWIDPFEGIETCYQLSFLYTANISVRIELTRLRGLRLSFLRDSFLVSFE